MVRRVPLVPLDLLASQALWGCRVPEDCQDFLGHLGPLGTGVPLGSEAPPGFREHLGKWVTEARGAQKVSVAPKVTLADLVPKGSLEWLGQVASRACQARMAGMVCQDSMARRGRLAAAVPQERRVPTGCRASLDAQEPKERRGNRVELGNWVRLAPLESQESLEMLAYLGSVVRLDTGVQRGLLAHKALLEPLVSEASRAGRAAWETPAFQVPRVSEAMWVTGAQEVSQALRETRALQVLMAFLGTKASWVPVAPLDLKERLAIEGSRAPKASRDPTALAESRASLGPQGP